MDKEDLSKEKEEEILNFLFTDWPLGQIEKVVNILPKITPKDVKLVELFDAYFHEVFIELVRHGSKDDFKQFIISITAAYLRVGNKDFTDFAQRWRHLTEMSQKIFTSLDLIMTVNSVKKDTKAIEIITLLAKKGPTKKRELVEMLEIDKNNLEEKLRELQKNQLIEIFTTSKEPEEMITLSLPGGEVAKFLKMEKS